MAFRSTTPRMLSLDGSSSTSSHTTGIAPMTSLTLASSHRSASRTSRCAELPTPQLSTRFGSNRDGDGIANKEEEDGTAVVTTRNACTATVLAKPIPKSCAGSRRSGVSASAHDPRETVLAQLPAFKEEVDAASRPPHRTPTLGEESRTTYPGRKKLEAAIEGFDVSAARALHAPVRPNHCSRRPNDRPSSGSS